MAAQPRPPAPSVNAAPALASLPPTLQEIFEVRLDRWWPDLHDGLAMLYPDHDTVALGAGLVTAAASAYAERDPALRRLDLERGLRPDWLQQPDQVGYAAYTERFAGTLAGVERRLTDLADLGVTYLHLMPLLTPREGDNDGGYAVADYRSVRPDLGTMDDLRHLAATLHERGMSLVLDLVLNHVAAEHPWARAATSGDARYRAYFHVFDDRTQPDAYERTLPEVFPDFAPGNFTWNADLNAWVWTTFNSFQWDVNWANPQVLAEYADIVLFLANVGVDVLRLDAIAFMWKRLGTTCQGQPEVHAITQVLRALTRIACPAVAFKAEAIVAPADLVQYLGTGRFTGKVSDLAYHNTLMVQVWSMLATKDVRLTVQALRALPPAPPASTWITYLRCHDDIGWAVADEDAAAVGLDGFAHRSFLAQWYTGEFPGSTARGLTFQANPHTHDRRICGTSAALIGLQAAQESDDADAVDLALAALRCAHAIVFGAGGLPVIWSGDELACPNDESWAREPGHESDNRWAHRPRIDTALLAAGRDATSVPGRARAALAHLARVRAGLAHLHAATPLAIGPVDDPGVLVTVRRHPLGTFVGLYNITPTWRPWPGHRIDEYGMRDALDALTATPLHLGDDGNAWLAPYEARWLTA